MKARTRRSPSSHRVLMTGPRPERHGGVSATLAALRPHLDPTVTWLSVGRRDRVDLWAAVRDPLRVSRATGALLQVNPSLRWRALLRDLALVRAWNGPSVAWIHGWDMALSRAVASSSAARASFVRGFRTTRFVVLAPVFVDPLVAMGISDDRIAIVPPAWSGVPLRRAPREPTIVFVGRIEVEKGVLELVRAAAALGVRLVLAGDGSAVGRARALAGSLGLSLELPGWVDAAARWRLLARASVFALPSHAEGVPVALLEAMAAGVPCVATAVGGIPWLTEGGRLARLVRVRDTRGLEEALSAALGDPGDCGPAVTRANGFAAPVVARQLERVWAATLADG